MPDKAKYGAPEAIVRRELKSDKCETKSFRHKHRWDRSVKSCTPREREASGRWGKLETKSKDASKRTQAPLTNQALRTCEHFSGVRTSTEKGKRSKKVFIDCKNLQNPKKYHTWSLRDSKPSVANLQGAKSQVLCKEQKPPSSDFHTKGRRRKGLENWWDKNQKLEDSRKKECTICLVWSKTSRR